MSPYVAVWAPELPVPIRMPSGKAYLHRILLFQRFGWEPQPCYWCGQVMEWAPRHAGITGDHLDGDPRNNAQANIVVACFPCNSTRGRGLLWYRLKGKPGEARALAHGPVRRSFVCGHEVAGRNVYRVRGVLRCLTCHRARARAYHQAKRVAQTPI